jgi:hypothetical protein
LPGLAHRPWEVIPCRAARGPGRLAAFPAFRRGSASAVLYCVSFAEMKVVIIGLFKFS